MDVCSEENSILKGGLGLLNPCEQKMIVAPLTNQPFNSKTSIIAPILIVYDNILQPIKTNSFMKSQYGVLERNDIRLHFL